MAQPQTSSLEMISAQDTREVFKETYLVDNGLNLILCQVYSWVVLKERYQQPLELILLYGAGVIQVVDLEGNCIHRL